MRWSGSVRCSPRSDRLSSPDEIRTYDLFPEREAAERSGRLLRAVIVRVVVSELAKRAEPWRADITHEYDEIVDLAVSFASA